MKLRSSAKRYMSIAQCGSKGLNDRSIIRNFIGIRPIEILENCLFKSAH